MVEELIELDRRQHQPTRAAVAISWVRNPDTGTISTEIDGRSLNIEPVGRMFEIWYGATGRRMRVGVADNLSLAKAIAEDLLIRLVSLNTFLEFHDDTQ